MAGWKIPLWMEVSVGKSFVNYKWSISRHCHVWLLEGMWFGAIVLWPFFNGIHSLGNAMPADFVFQVETEVRTLKFDDTGMFLLAGSLSRSCRSCRAADSVAFFNGGRFLVDQKWHCWFDIAKSVSYRWCSIQQLYLQRISKCQVATLCTKILLWLKLSSFCRFFFASVPSLFLGGASSNLKSMQRPGCPFSLMSFEISSLWPLALVKPNIYSDWY